MRDIPSKPVRTPAEPIRSGTRSNRRFTRPSRLAAAGILAAGSALASCSDLFSPGAGPPAALHAHDGVGQAAVVGSELGGLLVVRVVDRRGRPVEGAAVRWDVAEEDHGAVHPTDAATDAQGFATAGWRLGSRAGEQVATATLGGLAPARFTATALAGPPAALDVASGSNQAGAAGSPLGAPLVVRVADEFGNPVPDVAVTWQAVAGGGAVAPVGGWTDAHGLASAVWTLGPGTGENMARADAEALSPVFFFATARSGPPVSLEIVAGDGQIGAVAEELPEPLVVRVSDAHGNPVPGAAVAWTAGDRDTLTPSAATTDDDGEVAAAWRLGGAPVPRSAIASLPGLPEARFRATGYARLTAGVPYGGLSATAGSFSYFHLRVPLGSERLTVAVSGHGAPPRLFVRRGGLPEPDLHDCRGSLDGGVVACRFDGPEPGDWFVLLHAEGDYHGVELFGEIPFNMTIAGAYITQATQDLAGSVPLVAGRDALLRAFPSATLANDVHAEVRVHLFNDGSPVASQTITSPGDSVPTALRESPLSASWNLPLPGHLIQPGLAVLLELVASETSQPAAVFPASGEPLALDVRHAPPFRLRMVPVQAADGLRGDVTPANAEAFLEDARRMFPLAEIDWDIGTTYVTSTSLTNAASAWSTVLSEVNAMRVAEASDRYYYGVVRTGYTSGIAGMAYVGGRTALGWDRFPSATWVAAHEWGHNFGRWHAPCGGAGNTDANFPYSGGGIGVYGVDAAAGSLFTPAQHRDLMGYCSDRWISDYTYRGIMKYRAAESDASAAAAAVSAFGGAVRPPGAAPAPGAAQPVLLVWGRMDHDGLVLEPAFRIRARPELPNEPGPYALEGYDAGGARLFAFSFAGDPVAHGAAAGERHFAFAVLESWAPPERLARLRLTGPGQVVERSIAPPAPPDRLPSPEPTVVGRRGHAGEVMWDADAYPGVLVRDAATGRVLSFARGGRVPLPVLPAEVEAVVSDGVRSWTRRVAAPR